VTNARIGKVRNPQSVVSAKIFFAAKDEVRSALHRQANPSSRDSERPLSEGAACMIVQDADRLVRDGEALRRFRGQK
jgi:hypothetical protein